MKTLLRWGMLLLLLSVLLLGLLGSWRYGGLSGLLMRVRIARADLRPARHPLSVPTPLPASPRPRPRPH
jgi:hypothetical protein